MNVKVLQVAKERIAELEERLTIEHQMLEDTRFDARTLRAERDEAVALLRRYQECAFLSRIDADKAQSL